MARVRCLYVRPSVSAVSPLAEADASGRLSGSGLAEAVLLPRTMVVSVRLVFGTEISTAIVLDLNDVLSSALTAFSADSLAKLACI
jgi:hypothetical protein